MVGIVSSAIKATLNEDETAINKDILCLIFKSSGLGDRGGNWFVTVCCMFLVQ